MSNNNEEKTDYNDQMKKLLDEFISIIYKGHDHIIARKYYRDLFQQLIPKYFCLCKEDQATA
jgi:hypothetical protein